MMAHFCARVRKQAKLPSISVKDVYQHPTIRGLAASLPEGTPVRVDTAPVAGFEPVKPRIERRRQTRVRPLRSPAAPRVPRLRVRRGDRVVGVGYELDLGRLRLDRRLPAVGRDRGRGLRRPVRPADRCEVDADRALEAERSRSGASRYVRFWLVSTLIRLNPMVLFIGSPLYSLYLRALGAKIGRGVVIFSRNAPVCTDLLTIGDGGGDPQGRVLRRLSGRTAGVIETGRSRSARTRSSARRRCSTSGPISATARSSGIPPRCTRGRHPGRRAASRVARGAATGWTTAGRTDACGPSAVPVLRRTQARRPVWCVTSRSRRRVYVLATILATRAVVPARRRDFTTWVFLGTP